MQVGVETARPQIRQVATFVEDLLLSEQAEICHATFARTDLGEIVTWGRAPYKSRDDKF